MRVEIFTTLRVKDNPTTVIQQFMPVKVEGGQEDEDLDYFESAGRAFFFIDLFLLLV